MDKMPRERERERENNKEGKVGEKMVGILEASEEGRI